MLQRNTEIWHYRYSPIRHAGQLLTNSIEKACVFGAEFQSVFTREDLTCIPWLGRKCNSVIPIPICPKVPSVDYLQMIACYTGPYTHWKTGSSCSVILIHFRSGPSCGVCGSIGRSVISCLFAELSPPKCPIFMNYVTQCCFLWRTPGTWESGSQKTSTGECRLMMLVKSQTPGCTSSSGTSRAAPTAPGSWLSRGLWDPA